MKHVLILVLFVSTIAFAQDQAGEFHVQVGPPAMAAGAVSFAAGIGPLERMSASPVQGAPFSATITNESVQTLADGNRIVQTSTGTTARDSLGRTRQDAPLPPLGNMRPANAPHLVFIQDPVAQTSYTLNLTDKTALKGPSMAALSTARVRVLSGQISTEAPLKQMVTVQHISENVPGDVRTEDLSSQTMEGVLVSGVRTTHTIPAGQVGNEKPMEIVTEVWTSSDLKTVVYSKRTDPRMGDQTFKLTNIVRSEPDQSLFTVPADFKVIDGPDHDVIFYSPKQ
jgi:hypothetical protein